jgi:hypothetical protein
MAGVITIAPLQPLKRPSRIGLGYGESAPQVDLPAEPDIPMDAISTDRLFLRVRAAPEARAPMSFSVIPVLIS